jgi:hypothetical protein
MLARAERLAKVKRQPANAGSFGNAECAGHHSIRAPDVPRRYRSYMKLSPRPVASRGI